MSAKWFIFWSELQKLRNFDWEAPVYGHFSAVPYNLGVLFVFAFAVPPFAKHDRGVYVGWREGVGLVEQRDNTEKDSPNKGKDDRKKMCK